MKRNAKIILILITLIFLIGIQTSFATDNNNTLNTQDNTNTITNTEKQVYHEQTETNTEKQDNSLETNTIVNKENTKTKNITKKVNTNTKAVSNENISIRVNNTFDEKFLEEYWPDTIEISLLRNDIRIVNASLYKDDNFQYTFDNLPKYDEHEQEYEYTVRVVNRENNSLVEDGEVVKENYTISYSDLIFNETLNNKTYYDFNIVNTPYQENITLLIAKNWKDEDDRDGIRPNELHFYLHADGELVIDLNVTVDRLNYTIYNDTNIVPDLGDFKYLYFNGDPEFNEFYSSLVNDTTNPYDPFGSRIASSNNIEILLFNLPKYQLNGSGEEIFYEIWEDIVLKENIGYDVEIDPVTDFQEFNDSYIMKYKNFSTYYNLSVNPANVTDICAIINGHNPIDTLVIFEKIWDDDNNHDGVRPDSVDVQVYADGIPIDGTNLGEYAGRVYGGDIPENMGQFTFRNSGGYERYYVRYHDQGKEYNYSVKEIANGVPIEDGGRVGDYTVKYLVNDTYEKFDYYFFKTRHIKIVNTYEPELISVSVTKNWNDSEDQDGLRPGNVTVQLYKNNIPVGNYTYKNIFNQTLTDSGNKILSGDRLSYTWEGLRKYDGDGNLNHYEVFEIDANDNQIVNNSNYNEYKVTYSSRNNDYIITNTHIPYLTNISVKKEWNDTNNQDGKRPNNVTIQLLSNGVNIKNVTLNSSKWNYTFTDLPKYHNGTSIVYNVTELSVNEYTYKITGNQSTGYTITNTHIPEKTNISVRKVWDDADNQDGKRPNNVTIQLLSNGANIKNVTLNSSKWNYTFTDLPKYDNGKVINYTIAENSVTDYTTRINGYTIVNTHVPEKTEVSVRKVWDDADNQDGRRPKNITVNLLANGTVVRNITLNGTGNEWNYRFTELLKYQNGSEIRYTVDEVLPAGYTKSINGNTITNKHTPELTQVNVIKRWDDGNNRDGKRPKNITVNLLADNVKIQNVTLNSSKWNYTFKDLPKYQNGTLINYTITEDDVENYTTIIEGYTIVNSYTPELTDKFVTKTWNDKNNQDGIRPNNITVELYANGTLYRTIRLNSTNNWKYNITGLPKYENGKLINYSVYEKSIPSGYNVTYNDMNIINTHRTNMTEVTVIKDWEDNNNQDGLRPNNVTVQLYANGISTGKQAVLSERNNWRALFNNLDVYSGGVKIKYTVDEVTTIAGYTKRVTGTNNSYVIINRHVPEKTNVTVRKLWIDQDNQDGIRPTSILVNLLANGELVRNVTLNSAHNWNYTFTNLDKYSDGVLINYTVMEYGIPEGYTVSYDGTTIINTHTPSTVEVSVVKDWEDSHNQDGIRPNSITVQLYANNRAYGNTVVLSARNNWEHIFRDLPKNSAGKAINYTVDEVTVPTGYHRVVENIGHSFLIKNTHTPSTTEITVNKVWDDHNNQDKLRPENITIELLANGELYDTITLRARNNWTHTFTGLPEYANGEKIVYSVYEYGIPEEYTVSYDGNTIVNTHTPYTTEVTVIKAWNDSHNRDGRRPNSIRVQLYKNGESIGSPVVLSENNNWEHIYENLPMYDNGILVNYTVDELQTPNRYTKQVSSNDNAFVIVNSYTPSVINLTVNKIWYDMNNHDNTRPNNVTVDLFADGELVDTVVLNAANNWSYTFTDLPEYDSGRQVNYVVYEVDVPDDYIVSYDGYTIINDYDHGTTQVNVIKSWNDSHNSDGLRPNSIQVQLYRDGQATGSPVILNSANNWEHLFTNLTKYNNNRLIVYTVDEINTPSGYTKSISNVSNTYIITNTHIPEEISITVNKIWQDQDNNDNIRPNNITLELFADNELITSVVLDNSSWSYTFNDLPKYYQGKEIRYVVYEYGIPANYTVSYDGYNITNTHIPERTSVEVQKVWNDNHNSDGLRPASITVQLYANNQAIGQPVTLNSNNNWRYVFTDLPKYNNGHLITYKVDEPSKIRGYTKTITENDHSFIITNTHKPALTSYTVHKVWNDSYNRDGIRPRNLTVDLFADGELYESITLDAKNKWTHTFKNLPKYNNGKQIKYTIFEFEESDYYTATYNGSTITNTHIPEETMVEVVKVWDDNHNQDGIRPNSIRINLLANGKIKDHVILNSNNNWTHLFNNLPKYSKGKLIVYTVQETNTPTGYKQSIANNFNAFIITNTHTPKTTNLTVHKVWKDQEDNDGLRPEKITIELYADGELVKTITLNNNKWSYTFKNLPYYNHGKKIHYVLYEYGIPEGYTVSYDGYKIINTHVPEVTEVEVLKLWYDNHDQDGIRPQSISVALYADGNKYGDTIQLNDANNWKHLFTQLPKYHNGKQIKYTVQEIGTPSGYKTHITGNNGAYIITNTHTPETTNLTVIKVWEDNNNQDGLRPVEITIQVYADGKQINTITLNKENNWKYTYNNLPKYNNGKQVTYTIKENTPANYTTTYTQNGYTYTITNKINITRVPGNKTQTIKFGWAWKLIGLNGSYNYNYSGNHTGNQDNKGNNTLIDQKSENQNNNHRYTGRYYKYGNYYNRYNRYNRYYNWYNRNYYNRYNYNRHHFNPYNGHGSGYYQFYRLYIYLLTEYMDGNLTYEQFIALLDANDIRYFDENGTIIIDYENLEDVPEEITVEDTEDIIQSSSDNVDVTNPDKHSEPVIDSGRVEVEAKVDVSNQGSNQVSNNEVSNSVNGNGEVSVEE